MVDPLTLTVGWEVGEFLVKQLAGKAIGDLLADRKQQRAFANALNTALDKTREAGFKVQEPGAIDIDFLKRDGVRRELWEKLLDPKAEGEVGWAVLNGELEDVYKPYKVDDRDREAIEFFVDALGDELWTEEPLRKCLNDKSLRQLDDSLSPLRKRALVDSYFATEGARIRKDLETDLGEGNRYIEPLIEKRTGDRMPERRREPELPSEKPEREAFEPIDINQYFTDGTDRRIAVVADSGYGKTTLLRELFRRISENSKSKPHTDTYQIPVYLTPSQAAECSETNVEEKLKVRMENSGCRPNKVARLVYDEFHRGSFLFLIDALDQVTDRENLRGALEGNAFRDNRVVITTRPNVYHMEKGHLRDYAHLQIREFDESRWEEYVGADRLSALKDVVDDEFLKVPILLKLVVEHWLPQSGESARPKNRAALYRRMFANLIHRQEEIDSIRSVTGRTCNPQDVFRYLRMLAYKTLVEGHLGQFPRDTAIGLLGQQELKDIEGCGGIVTVTLVELSAEMAFRHRSFQEYLAADYLHQMLKSKDDLVKLDTYICHPNWEESLRFLSGMLIPELALSLVDKILDPPRDAPLVLYRDHLRLAAVCLREMGAFADRQREEVVNLLEKDFHSGHLQDTVMSTLAVLKTTKAVDALIGLLKHKDISVRERAADFLRAIRSESAIGGLLEALHDSDPHVCQSAADALGAMRSESAIDGLLEALHDPEGDARATAALALRANKSERAVEALLGALHDPGDSVRGSAAYALGAIKSESAIGGLLEALHDSEAHVRGSAADALGAIKSESVIGGLLEALHDPDPHVRGCAGNALGMIKSERAVQSLLQLALHDPSAFVRGSAAWALEQIESERAVEPLLEALHDTDDSVRGCAAAALGGIKSERAVEPLLQLALDDPHGVVRASAAWALGQIKSERAVEPLLQLALDDPNDDARESAVWALSAIKSERAVESLLQLALHDPNDGVRRKAAWVLGDIGSDRAVQPLIEALHNRDASVRGRVAQALGEIGSASALAGLLEFWHRLKDESNRPFLLNAIASCDRKVRSRQKVAPLP